jgi:hypothetical protein
MAIPGQPSRNITLAGDDPLALSDLGPRSLTWSHDFPAQLVRGIGVTPNLLYLGTMHGMIYAFVPPQPKSAH